MSFHLNAIVKDPFGEDYDLLHQNITSLRFETPKMSVSEFRRLREEEEEMEKNMCLYNLPEYLAVAALPLFTVGLILTGISVYVYTRPCQLKTTVGYLLAFLSIFEWFFLLTSFEVFSISSIPFFYCLESKTDYPKFKAYSQLYVYPLTHVTKYMCVCISIMISVQQWIAVFLPMEAKSLCNMKRTKFLLIVSFIFSIIISIPRFVEEKISFEGHPITDKKWKEHIIIKIINSFDDHIFNAFIIFFVLLIINISIICLLKWSQRERMRMTSQSFKDRRTALMLLAVLLSYVATNFPSMLIEYNHVDSLFKKLLPVEISNVRKEISNFFMCCHPLFSFADYMIFSEKYRATVKSMFCRNTKGHSSSNQHPV